MTLTDTFYSFVDAPQIMSWTLKHPENWTPEEVLDWLYYYADIRDVDCSKFRGEAFRTINGETLCKMTINDFIEVEPCYGRLFYDLLREQIKCGRFGILNLNFFKRMLRRSLSVFSLMIFYFFTFNFLYTITFYGFVYFLKKVFFRK